MWSYTVLKASIRWTDGSSGAGGGSHAREREHGERKSEALWEIKSKHTQGRSFNSKISTWCETLSQTTQTQCLLTAHKSRFTQTRAADLPTNHKNDRRAGLKHLRLCSSRQTRGAQTEVFGGRSSPQGGDAWGGRDESHDQTGANETKGIQVHYRVYWVKPGCGQQQPMRRAQHEWTSERERERERCLFFRPRVFWDRHLKDSICDIHFGYDSVFSHLKLPILRRFSDWLNISFINSFRGVKLGRCTAEICWRWF